MKTVNCNNVKEVVRREEKDEGFQKADYWIREHTLYCHEGFFSTYKQKDYDFFLLNCHINVLRRQLEKVILVDWAQGKVASTGVT